MIMGLRLNYKATSRILAECARLESVDQDCTFAVHICSFAQTKCGPLRKLYKNPVVALAPIENPPF